MSLHRWTVERLADLVGSGVFCDGDWVETKDQDPNGDVRLLQLSDVGDAYFRDKSNRWLREDQASRLGATYLSPGDILISRLGEPLGKACFMPKLDVPAITAVDVAILRVDRTDVEPKWILWYLNSPDARAQVMERSSGTTRLRISRKNLGEVLVPVPPLDQQKRIVAQLEDQLGKLEAVRARLGNANSRSEEFRASVLKLLFEPSDSVGGHREWEAVELGELLTTIRNGLTYQNSPLSGGLPISRIQTISDGSINGSLVGHAELEHGDVGPHLLEEGDLLFSHINSFAHVGKVALVRKEHLPLVHGMNLLRLTPDVARVIPEFLLLALRTHGFLSQVRALTRNAVNQASINIRNLSRCVLFLPSLGEQSDIVSRFAEIDFATSEFGEGVKQAEAHVDSARSSILHRAFLAPEEEL